MRKIGFCIIVGWNAFERLSTNDGKKYIPGGLLNFLQTVFVKKILPEKIELNSIVKRICMYEDERYVRIEILRNNEDIITYQAKHVVCTQSIGCLKKTMKEMFVPPLPYAKQISIEKLGFGTINKVCFIHVFFVLINMMNSSRFI